MINLVSNMRTCVIDLDDVPTGNVVEIECYDGRIVHLLKIDCSEVEHSHHVRSGLGSGAARASSCFVDMFTHGGSALLLPERYISQGTTWHDGRREHTIRFVRASASIATYISA